MVSHVKDSFIELQKRLQSQVLGSEDASRLLVTALLAGGHVLIQGAPGIGKTSLAKVLAQSISGKFSRIQFTPDLLPSDILGYSIYDQSKSEFRFIEGPVFSNILLADEINRTSPRIQSALLESMNERQVSIDGVTRRLEQPFMVIATQNTLYATGTYPLPEPQLDRFLMSINMSLPDAKTQGEMLQLHASGGGDVQQSPMLTSEEVRNAQKQVHQLPVHERICAYIADLCEAARNREGVRSGLSARASIALMRAAQAAAFLEGNEAVYPDDVKNVARPVLFHRLATSDVQAGNMAGMITGLDEVLRLTPAP